MEHIGSYLADLEEYKYEGSDLEEAVNRIEKLRDDIVKAMGEIDVTWVE